MYQRFENEEFRIREQKSLFQFFCLNCFRTTLDFFFPSLPSLKRSTVVP